MSEMKYKSKSKDYMKSYNAQYYARNKDKILKHISKRVVCPDCYREVNYQNLKKHRETKLCQKARENGIVCAQDGNGIERVSVVGLVQSVAELQAKIDELTAKNTDNV